MPEENGTTPQPPEQPSSPSGGGAPRWLNGAIAVVLLLVAVLGYGLVARHVNTPDDPLREANPTGLVGDILQVEVRNACGVPGLAGEMTRYLRRRGFDVVEVGDHEVFDLQETVVVDRVGDLAAAAKLAAAIGLPASRVEQDLRPDYYLDASILLGKDYASLTPFSDD